MHMHIARFLVLHIFVSLCTAGPLPQPNPSKSLPGVLAVRGSAHYKTRWIEAKFPFEYETMAEPPPEIWTGGEPFVFESNKLAQNGPLMYEAVAKCQAGQCKYYGEGAKGIAWLVTLSDQKQHILKVMFAHGTHNKFKPNPEDLDSDSDSEGFASVSTDRDDFARAVYMTNRVTQLDAFGVLKDSENEVFYILMPHMGLPFQEAFKRNPRKFTNENDIFVWKEGDGILQKYGASYGLTQRKVWNSSTPSYLTLLHSRDVSLNNFVFNEEPWDVRVVDWDGASDQFTARPNYAKIRKLVVKVEDSKKGYYDHETNHDHVKNRKEMGRFFQALLGETLI
ncbi:hypothetical protein H0H93_001785 [Arthromyces matolae]|nr:hypothetical protein H0H93_001785 [Arthromyces matolae]